MLERWLNQLPSLWFGSYGPGPRTEDGRRRAMRLQRRVLLAKSRFCRKYGYVRVF